MAQTAKTIAGARARQLWLHIGGPIFALVLAAVIGALAVFSNFAHQQDTAFVSKSRQLVAAQLRGRTRALTNTTADYAIWDEAYGAVTHRWDPAWVRANMYSSAADGLLIFRGDGAVRYAWFAPAIPKTVTGAADAVARSAPLDRLIANALAADVGARFASGFASVGGELIVFSAAPITPESASESAPRRHDAPTDFLMSIDVLDAAELTQLGELAGVQDITFQPGAPPAAPAVYAINDASGNAAGALAWRNEKPGSAAFIGQVWPILVGLLFLGLAATLTAWMFVSRQIEALARTESEIEANRSKSETIAVLGAELRAPLNAILSNTRHLQRGDAARGPEIGRIANAAKWVLEAIDKLIEESHLDVGRLQPAVEPIAVQGVLERVVEMVAPAARAKGTPLTFYAEADVREALADRLRLTQCLVNLCWTALRVTQGRIEIHAARRRRNGVVCIAFDIVTAKAAMSEAEAEALFTPLGRRSAGGKAWVTNQSLTRKLARAMGGDAAAAVTAEGALTLSLYAPAAEPTLKVA